MQCETGSCYGTYAHLYEIGAMGKCTKPLDLGLNMLSNDIKMQIKQLTDTETIILKEIEESIVECGKWPNYILRMFFTKGLKHGSRAILAAFCWFNALHPDLYMTWIGEHGCARDMLAFKEFSTLYCSMKNDQRKWKHTYTWDIITGTYCYLDGVPRIPGETRSKSEQKYEGKV